MVFCNSGQERDWIAATNSSAALTAGQKALLVAELTTDPEGRDYATPLASANWVQLQAKLHEHYTFTIAAHASDRESIPRAEFLPLVSRIAGQAGQGSDQQKSVWDGVRDSIMIATNFESVALQDPAVAATVAALDSAGLLTAEQLLQLTKEPQDAVEEIRAPRAGILMGFGQVVEISDLESLRAEELI